MIDRLHGRPLTRATLLIGLIVVAAGISPAAASGSVANAAVPTAPHSTPTPTLAPPLTPPRLRTVSTYFRSTLYHGLLTPTARSTRSVAVLTAAMAALLRGPTTAEKAVGFASSVPAGLVLHHVRLHGGIATIGLTSRTGRHIALPDAGLAQIVFTATQFPQVRGVVVDVDGHHLGPGLHRSAIAHVQGHLRVLRRADFERWAPAVLVESPVFGDTIHSPVRVRGSANVFEAVFRVEITDWDGRIVAARTVRASSGTGTRGTFDVTIPYVVTRAGSGEIITSFASPKDGSRVVVGETLVTVAR